MKTHSREILIYYNPDSSSDRKTVAHAKSMSRHVKAFAYDQTPSTSTSWYMILNSLDIHPKEILNKAHPYYQQNIRGREFSTTDWINVLQHNPGLIKAPIAVRGSRAILCNNPTDVYKLVEVSVVSS